MIQTRNSETVLWEPLSGEFIEQPSEIKEKLLSVTTPLYILKREEKSKVPSRSGSAYLLHPSLPEQKGEMDFKIEAFVPALPPENFGDKTFKKRHRIKYAYIAGAMANGITSESMLEKMAEHGMTAFYGAGGLAIDKIEQAAVNLKSRMQDKTFGFNFIHTPGYPGYEMELARLYIKHDINLVSAAAFMKITLPLVYYRIKGIHRDSDGSVRTPNNVIAKVSRIEVARQFFSPPPESMVNQLVENNLVTVEEAALSREIPMAQDLTAEADSGGHTDNRPALALLPTMISLKNEYSRKYNYAAPLCVGLGGGISTPESAAAAFQMGAGYILTGSVNQSCIEAGICDDVKKLLGEAEQADVAMAPAADMFEIGAKVQVLKRGTMFPVRAEKLYRCYKNYNAFQEIPEKERKQIEQKILMVDFEEKWNETKEFFKRTNDMKIIERAEQDAKYKMALVFRSYLGLSSKWAITGDLKRKMDYQIWCGPSIGAFNQWVKGSFLENIENRSVSLVALNILFGAAVCTRISWLRNQGIDPGLINIDITPRKKDEILSFIQ